MLPHKAFKKKNRRNSVYIDVPVKQQYKGIRARSLIELDAFSPQDKISVDSAEFENAFRAHRTIIKLHKGSRTNIREEW